MRYIKYIILTSLFIGVVLIVFPLGDDIGEVSDLSSLPRYGWHFAKGAIVGKIEYRYRSRYGQLFARMQGDKDLIRRLLVPLAGPDSLKHSWSPKDQWTREIIKDDKRFFPDGRGMGYAAFLPGDSRGTLYVYFMIDSNSDFEDKDIKGIIYLHFLR